MDGWREGESRSDEAGQKSCPHLKSSQRFFCTSCLPSIDPRETSIIILVLLTQDNDFGGNRAGSWREGTCNNPVAFFFFFYFFIFDSASIAHQSSWLFFPSPALLVFPVTLIITPSPPLFISPYPPSPFLSRGNTSQATGAVSREPGT